jgi:hypothetical protein
MPTRRMRHRQLLGDDLVRLHVDDAAAFGAAVAPAVDDVAPERWAWYSVQLRSTKRRRALVLWSWKSKLCVN